MPVIFYDMETSGPRTAFDQIIRVAAIRTDSILNELSRFEIECRLQPHIVPAPAALRNAGIAVSRLSDASLPTHYEMVRRLRNVLHSWSPALFIGYESYRTGEHFLRQALYQTLHPCFLTNTGGNSRIDAMHLVQAASIFAPGALAILQGESGAQLFDLESVSQANGKACFGQAVHRAESTLHLCRIVQEAAPEIWSSFMRLSQKAAVVETLADEEMLSFSAVYNGRAYSWLVASLGQSSLNGAHHYVFELGFDPEDFRQLSDEQLAQALRGLPRPVHTVRCNGSPILLPAADAPDIARSKTLGTEELLRRARVLRADGNLRARLVAARDALQVPRAPGLHVEDRIYDSFVSRADEARMEAFHAAFWEQRMPLLQQFEDARLAELGKRLIFMERPDVLTEAQRHAALVAIARRLSGPESNVPWLRIDRAIAELDGLDMQANDSEGASFRSYLRAYLAGRQQQAAEILEELG